MTEYMPVIGESHYGIMAEKKPWIQLKNQRVVHSLDALWRARLSISGVIIIDNSCHIW